MTGRIHDVDGDAVPAHCGIFRHDRDSFFTLERIRIEQTVGENLSIAEQACLPQYLVHERRFAVVNVCDDGNVANVGASLHGSIGLIERKRYDELPRD